MARIAGVNIPENKHLEIALTHIYGIGRVTAQKICEELKIDYTKKVSDISEDDLENIRTAVAVSPCGWYLPITSPTIRADFL